MIDAFENTISQFKLIEVCEWLVFFDCFLFGVSDLQHWLWMNIETDVIRVHIDVHIHRKRLWLDWLVHLCWVVVMGHIANIAIVLIIATQMTIKWLLKMLLLLLKRAKVKVIVNDGLLRCMIVLIRVTWHVWMLVLIRSYRCLLI